RILIEAGSASVPRASSGGASSPLRFRYSRLITGPAAHWARARWCVLALAVFFLSVPVLGDESAPAARQTILIYYANETSKAAVQSDNYRKVLAVLRNNGGPQAEPAAASISRDGERFPVFVRRDVNDLLDAARRWKFDLAVFTNEMAFENRFLFYRAS